MFKISMFNCGYYDLMKQAGFDSIMIGWRDSDRIETLEKARNAGLLVENIHAPTYNSDDFWIDNLNGEDYMKCLLTSVEDCKRFNIPTMVAHISYSTSPPPNDVGMRRFLQITEKAEQSNINVALENTGANDHIHYIFNNIDSGKLGFCFDSGHQNLIKTNINCLEDFGNRLMAMHLNDNDGNEDTHLLPFDGTIDWGRITQQLKKIQYKGAIAFEVDSNKNEYMPENPEKFFREAYNRAMKLIDMINR